MRERGERGERGTAKHFTPTHYMTISSNEEKKHEFFARYFIYIQLAQGRLRQTLRGKKTYWDAESINAGMYFYFISINGQRVTTGKLIKL